MTASLPANPTAHDSVARYLEVMRSVCIRVAEGRDEMEHAAVALNLNRSIPIGRK
jgi:hypothetical protein